MKNNEKQNIVLVLLLLLSLLILTIESGFFMILFNVILPWIFNVSWHLTFWKAFVLSIFINIITWLFGKKE